uniref:Uncharacterized protein n=1 Tax=Knipowitschia caucasica TaxID=637954 RepID=A0AAV2K1F4_KNICA
MVSLARLPAGSAAEMRFSKRPVAVRLSPHRESQSRTLFRAEESETDGQTGVKDKTALPRQHAISPTATPSSPRE